MARALIRVWVAVSVLFVLSRVEIMAQSMLRVVSAQDSTQAIEGATVSFEGDKEVVHTDARGETKLPATWIGHRINVRHVGYIDRHVHIAGANRITVQLIPRQNEVDEVLVSTGYFSAPRERLSGSFTHIDNRTLSRNASTNILDRLEGITNGLQFDRGDLSGEDIDGSPMLRVRGASTLVSDSRPLVIVDDFPFEGDIRTINPDDVESVTVLKDASAASIWGARAGNGVIVINMKKGQYLHRTEASFQSSLRVSARPDLFFSRSVLRPETVMDIQQSLFEKGAYTETNISRIPAFVELLIKRRDGLVTEAEFEATRLLYQNSDIRTDAEKYLYRPAVQQQYSLGLRGGERSYRYSLSAGYHRQSGHIIGQHSARRNVSFQNGMRLFEGMEIEGTVRYTGTADRANSFSRAALENSNIYLPLVDGQGNSLPVPIAGSSIRYGYQERAESLGLLDWMYRPIDELHETRFDTHSGNTTLGFTASYRTPVDLRIRASYYLNDIRTTQESFFSEKSYYTRDLVNKYTQENGTRIIPDGAVLREEAPRSSRSHSLRLQTDYNRAWADGWRLDALAGFEASDQVSRSGVPFTMYGYDVDTEMGTPQTIYGRETHITRPNGNRATVPWLSADPSRTVQRNLSMYNNWGLSWKEQYIFNGSIRWDGSNLLGVKTNARGVALWSVGGAWNMHNAPFYRWDDLRQLKLRMTYGSAGNIDRSQGHLPVITKYSASIETGVPYAVVNSPGNPSLRWEQVTTFNAGIDWALKGNVLSGSIEYYRKHARHLLSTIAIDPTLGVSDGFMQNYANIRNQGLDLSLNSSFGIGGFHFDNHLLLNYTTNKVTKVNSPKLSAAADHVRQNYYTVNESRDMMFSIPWNGLNPENGLPIVRLADGTEADSHRTYYEGLEFSDLVRSGLRVSPFYGSLRLGARHKGLSISTLLIFKLGHVTLRKSYVPGQEHNILGHLSYHMDYYDRWQKTGDELHTDVPASVGVYDSWMSLIYQYSEHLITPLDNVRLHDLNLSYAFDKQRVKNWGLQGLEITSSLQNVGLLWVKNKQGVHPEFPHTVYPQVRQFYLGLRLSL